MRSCRWPCACWCCAASARWRRGNCCLRPARARAPTSKSPSQARSNEGTGAARDYKAVGHIPAGTAFVAGSAAGENGSTVTYSIDGGKTFSTQPIVEERQPDGTVKRTPAPVSMYTEVRYEWSDALAAGGKLSASYKVRVK